MYTRNTLVALLCPVMLSVTAAADERTSTHQEFNEFAAAMIGSFRSDIRLIHDWPGHEKKKGDRISGTRVARPVADGSGFIATETAGAGVQTEVFRYNALTRKIECVGIANGGTTWNSIIWKGAPTRWNWKVKASLKDGTPIKGTGAWVIVDGGKQLDFVSNDIVIGDAPADRLHDRYYRVDSPGAGTQDSHLSLEKLLQAMQGKWVREWTNNKGEQIRREKVIQGRTETVTDYGEANQIVNKWTVPFEVERIANKFNVFRNRSSTLFYIFDVDENYWYELHDLKRSKSMLPAFRREKSISNQNENTLKGLERWIGAWRGNFSPTPLKGYAVAENGPLQVDFVVEKNALATTVTFSWLTSRQDTGEVVTTVNGYLAWSAPKRSHVLHYITSSGVNVAGTVSLRGKTHLMTRSGNGPDGSFTETCILEFPNADTIIHKVINRVHNGKPTADGAPVTLKRVK